MHVCELQPAPPAESAELVASLVRARGRQVDDLEAIQAAVQLVGTRPTDLNALAHHMSTSSASPKDAANAVVREAASQLRRALLNELSVPNGVEYVPVRGTGCVMAARALAR